MTKIEWTEKTWNPIVGCSIVSPGCTNCYAMRMAGRLEAMNTKHHDRGDVRKVVPHYDGMTQPSNAGPVWTGKVAMAPEHVMTEPLKRRKPTTYFVNSMGDLFHEDVPDEWIDRVFAVMALTPQHTFQVLTKRSARMRAYLAESYVRARGHRQHRIAQQTLGLPTGGASGIPGWPLPNVWLGVSAERQQEADARTPDLLATPAAVRFVSLEPLLGPIDLERVLFYRAYYQVGAGHYVDVLRGGFWSPSGPGMRASQDGEPTQHFTNHSDIQDSVVNWVIVGGESGPAARPMHPDWARSIRDQCAAASVPFFFKQWGEWTPGENVQRTTGVVEVAYSDGDEPFFFGRENLACTDGHVDDEPTLYRVGKKAAGRQLDGREWNEMPEPHSPH